MELAAQIAALRKKHGFSQEELGEKLGVSRQALERRSYLELLLQKSPQGAPLPAFGFLEGVDRDAPIPEEFARMPDALRQYYDVPPNSNPNAMTINIFFRRLADQYRRTGRDEYAKLFAECQKIYFDRYEGSLDARKTPPNFPFLSPSIKASVSTRAPLEVLTR